jgi:hypothetical protein
MTDPSAKITVGPAALALDPVAHEKGRQRS